MTTATPPSGLTATGGVISDYTSGPAVYRAHIFTSSGTFTVTAPGVYGDTVEYLVVAGGGGGGGGYQAGAGGAGGYRSSVTGESTGGGGTLESAIPVSTSPGSYTVTVTSNGCSSVSLPVSVDSINCVIQKGISVTNDGKNDTFDLAGFNVKKLTIFNRYGLKVYDKNDYTNEWGGQSNTGDELPDGTYYYVIARDNGQNKSGWIYINRAQ